MRASHPVLFALFASSSLVNAEFYIIRGVASNPPNCVGDAGCTPVPASISINVIGVADFGNCDALGGLQGTNGYDWVDPVCPASGSQGGQPFTAVGNACGLTNQQFYFRVQSKNPGQLDAATDSNFSDIVANCYKQPNFGDFGDKRCSTPADYTAEYQCSPLNGSAC